MKPSLELVGGDVDVGAERDEQPDQQQPVGEHQTVTPRTQPPAATPAHPELLEGCRRLQRPFHPAGSGGGVA